MPATRHLVVRVSADQAEFDKGLAIAKANATRFSKELSRDISNAYYGSKDEAKVQNAIAAGLDKQVIDSLREQMHLKKMLANRSEELSALRENIQFRHAAVASMKEENAVRIQVQAATQRQLEMDRLRQNIIERTVAAQELEATLMRQKAGMQSLLTSAAVKETYATPISGGAAVAGVAVARQGLLATFNDIARLVGRGGGVAIGAMIIANLIERWGNEFKKAKSELIAFGMEQDAVLLATANTIPIVGDIFRGIRSAFDASLGVDEAKKLADDLEKKRRDMESAKKEADAERLRQLEREDSYLQRKVDREHKAMWDAHDQQIRIDEEVHMARMRAIDEEESARKSQQDADYALAQRIFDQGQTQAERIFNQLDEARRLVDEGIIGESEFQKYANSLGDKTTANDPGYRPVGAAMFGSQEAFSAIARAQAPQVKKLDEIAKNTKAVADWAKSRGVNITVVGP